MPSAKPKMMLGSDKKSAGQRVTRTGSKKPANRTNDKGNISQKKRPVNVRKLGKEQMIAVTYRNRTPQDDAYILQITRQQLGTVHEQAFGEPFPDVQFMRYIQSGAPTFMVLQNERPIGYYSYLLGHDKKMHISALVIEQEFQSKGIGSEVMKHLEADAMLQGVQLLEVFVQETNKTSLAFTKSLGFQEVFRVTPFTIAFQKKIG